MAKQITLVELSSQDKKRLMKVSSTSIVVTILLCFIVVGCVACNQEQNNEPTDEQQRLYWSSIVANSKWLYLSDTHNNGILGDYIAPYNLEIKQEGTKLKVYFRNDSAYYVDEGLLTLTSCDGTINFEDKRVWYVHFSEQDNEKYMSIKDSKDKIVYFKEGLF